MVNGSNTTSEQEKIVKPLNETNPVTDEIAESEVTIAMLTGEILRIERSIGFYLYGIFAIIGLAVFIVIWSAFHQKELLNALNTSSNTLYTYLLFGIIFAGIFIYNRTTRQMKGYYDSLLTEQNILLTFKLMEDSKDENEKAKIVSQMLTNLISTQNSSSLSSDESVRPHRATIK